jgi:hypothetical protein
MYSIILSINFKDLKTKTLGLGVGYLIIVPKYIWPSMI